MSKQMVEVTLPMGLELVPGQVFEWLIDDQSDPHARRVNFKSVFVRKAWVWPEWLKAPWIAMDENEWWYAYENEPKPLRDCWNANGGDYVGLPFNAELFDFNLPPCTDWRTSKRMNPSLAQPKEQP